MKYHAGVCALLTATVCAFGSASAEPQDFQRLLKLVEDVNNVVKTLKPTAEVNDFVLGKSAGASGQISVVTTTFEPTDTIAAIVSSNSSSPPSEAVGTLRFRWMRGGALLTENKTELKVTENMLTTATLSDPNGLPPGDYSVEVFLNDTSIKRAEFSVLPSAAMPSVDSTRSSSVGAYNQAEAVVGLSERSFEDLRRFTPSESLSLRELYYESFRWGAMTVDPMKPRYVNDGMWIPIKVSLDDWIYPCYLESVDDKVSQKAFFRSVIAGSRRLSAGITLSPLQSNAISASIFKIDFRTEQGKKSFIQRFKAAQTEYLTTADACNEAIQKRKQRGYTRWNH